MDENMKKFNIEKPKHVMNVKPNYYDAILNGTFRLRGEKYSDGDLIVYHEVGIPVGASPRPPLRRRLRAEKNQLNKE